ncbi:hypothetical protein, partial [Anaeromassilibacillus sp. 1001302B_160321_C8]|uniref:hypothetical protein n=1 Tax=Anaeromassilibacillus sp. 1001302B_160321_C8 TaxID=2787132 RepID=UPI001A9B983F
RMPPLLADFSHARACKPFCEKYLTLPWNQVKMLWDMDRTILAPASVDTGRRHHYNKKKCTHFSKRRAAGGAIIKGGKSIWQENR